MGMDNLTVKTEAYEAATAKLQNLIDNPVKTVTWSEYKEMIRAAHKAKNRAYRALRRAIDAES